MMMKNGTLKRRLVSGGDDRKAKFPRSSLVRPIRSPSLIVIPEDNDCFLYNPHEDKVFKPEYDVSGFRFLASSGKWFLVVDPRLNLSIIDLFSGKKIDLPPLESLDGATATYILERTKDRDTELREKVFVSEPGFSDDCGPRTAEGLRGLLWVDEDKEELEYAVVWRFDNNSHYIGFCKSGFDHHIGASTYDKDSIRWNLRGLTDMVLQRDSIYIFTVQRCIRILQFSGQDGLKDVSVPNYRPIYQPALTESKQGTKIISTSEKIAVTRSGEVLMVYMRVYEDAITSTRHRIFSLSKRDPTLDQHFDCNFAEVDSLGDEALFLDSGIMAPADKTLGIEPNSIYFTREERVCSKYPGPPPILDICVYNLATKTFKRCPGFPDLKIKDALWFIPS